MSYILVLAADPEVQDIFRAMLEKYNLQVQCISTVDEARSALQPKTPRLFLSDVDGLAEPLFGMYHWMLEQAAFADLPRLFVAGSESEGSDLVRLLEGSSSEVLLRKPLQRSEFLHSLKQLLKRRTTSYAPLPAGPPAPGPLPFPGPPALPVASIGAGSPTPSLSGFVGQQVGTVTLRQEIGRGGMGAVFLGFQTALKRKVAVKMILPELVNNSTMMARFHREALAMAQLKSPHVVQVFDAGYTSNGVFYMVMEFLEGRDLEVLLQKHRSFSLDDTLRIGEHVLKGLVAAHGAGIIHRDLKPSNLIMSEEGHTTVTDFGLARQFEAQDMRFTRPGAMLGTPYYFSPEQGAGRDTDARSDLYSLGIVLYELLTGQVPFPSNNLAEMLNLHSTAPLPDPRELLPELPFEVVKMLKKMTAKAPAERYQDAQGLLREIKQMRLELSQPSGVLNRTLVSSDLPVGFRPSLAPASSDPSALIVGKHSLRLSLTGLELPIDPAQRLCSFQMSSIGALTEKDGSLSPSWRGAMQLLLAMSQQLEDIVQAGGLQYGFCESDVESLFWVLQGQELEGMSFSLNSVPTSLRMSISSEMVSVPPPSASMSDPLLQLSSTAGVEGLLLLGPDGSLCQHTLAPEIPVEPLIIKLKPLISLFSSMTVPIKGLDCCFERKRAMLWRVDSLFLVVFANHRMNKSLLTILLQQYKGALQAYGLRPGQSLYDSYGGVGRLSSPSLTGSSPSFAPSSPAEGLAAVPVGGGDVLPKEAVAALTKEFARFIGPMSKLLVKKEAKKMGASAKALPRSMAEAFVGKLAGHLDANKREEFLQKALGLLDDF